MIAGQAVTLTLDCDCKGWTGIINRVIVADGALGGIFEVLEWTDPQTGRKLRKPKGSNWECGKHLA